MVVRKNLSLPDGYCAKQIATLWYLADPRGVPLLCSADATEVEIHAWRHVWRTRHEEFVNELAAYRAGVRLPELCGRRDSPGMSDAVARAQPEPEKRRTRITPVRRRVFVTAAVATAAGLVIGVVATGRIQEGPTALPAPNSQAALVPATLPKPLATVLERAAAPKTVRSVGAARVPGPRARTARRLRRVARRPNAQYAVSVGNYANPANADRMKHLVRSKGYIVEIVPHGAVSQVMTPPYRTRVQAERVARGLEEIRLPAQLIARRGM